jgi:hypothetical protein
MSFNQSTAKAGTSLPAANWYMNGKGLLSEDMAAVSSPIVSMDW